MEIVHWSPIQEHGWPAADGYPRVARPVCSCRLTTSTSNRRLQGLPRPGATADASGTSGQRCCKPCTSGYPVEQHLGTAHPRDRHCENRSPATRQPPLQCQPRPWPWLLLARAAWATQAHPRTPTSDPDAVRRLCWPSSRCCIPARCWRWPGARRRPTARPSRRAAAAIGRWWRSG